MTERIQDREDVKEVINAIETHNPRAQVIVIEGQKFWERRINLGNKIIAAGAAIVGIAAASPLYERADDIDDVVKFGSLIVGLGVAFIGNTVRSAAKGASENPLLLMVGFAKSQRDEL